MQQRDYSNRRGGGNQDNDRFGNWGQREPQQQGQSDYVRDSGREWSPGQYSGQQNQHIPSSRGQQGGPQPGVGSGSDANVGVSGGSTTAPSTTPTTGTGATAGNVGGSTSAGSSGTTSRT